MPVLRVRHAPTVVMVNALDRIKRVVGTDLLMLRSSHCCSCQRYPA